jgi:hypothetical protein
MPDTVAVTPDICNRLMCGALIPDEAGALLGVDGVTASFSCSLQGYVGQYPACGDECHPYRDEIQKKRPYLLIPCGASVGQPVSTLLPTPPPPIVTAPPNAIYGYTDYVHAEPQASCYPSDCTYSQWISEHPFMSVAALAAAFFLLGKS